MLTDHLCVVVSLRLHVLHRCLPSPVHTLRRSHERVKAAIHALSSREGHTENDPLPEGGAGGEPFRPPVSVLSWSASQLTGVDNWDSSEAWNFRTFQERFLAGGEPIRSEFPKPESLPPLPASVDPGPFPELEDVLSRVGRCECNRECGFVAVMLITRTAIFQIFLFHSELPFAM